MNISDKPGGKRVEYVVYVHVLIGVCFFYFLIHPLTMVMYWFEISDTSFSIKILLKIFPERIQGAFTIRMAPLAALFAFLGGLAGLGSGLYYRNILNKSRILHIHEEELGQHVRSLIQTGESEKVEYKSSLRFDYHLNKINKALEHEVLKTVAGFLNSKGGELLIGVSDNKEIVDLKNDFSTLKKKNRDGFELRLYQIISSTIGVEYSKLIQIIFCTIDDKDVCYVKVKPSRSPAYVVDNGNTSFYIRVGNSTKTLTIKEAVRYINSRISAQGY